MKVALTTLIILAGFSSVAPVLADEVTTADNASTVSAFPRGGWDGNDVRLSVTRSKVAVAAKPGGGWDLNNVRVSVTRSKLIR
jgi:hypothetical protein